MLSKAEVLGPLAAHRTDEVVVATMSVVRPWGRCSDSDLDLASADSAMGHAADLALGIAMAQPSRKVVCLNGDGSMLMSLGTLATIVATGVTNLILILIENGGYEITGNQPLPGAGSMCFADLARAAGFRQVREYESAASYERELPTLLAGEGPVFVSAKVERGHEGPISRSEAETAAYLKVSMFDSVRVVRKALVGE